MSTAEEKARLRGVARDVRSRAALVGSAAAAAAIAARAGELSAVRTVAFYWPMKDEIDPRPLATRLAEAGATVLLPTTRSGIMTFSAFTGEATLLKGPFGTSEPPPGEEVVPDLVLVPLLAFDRTGCRLGYGKGHYDRYLAAHPTAVAVGLAFAAQEMPGLPAGPHDVALAAILTEREFIRTGAAR